MTERAGDHNGPIIVLEDVSRVYRMGESEVRALDHVSLAVQRGEFMAIMGPSGSGKSTMLNVLGCLDSPSAGRYLLDGEPVERLSEDQLADVRQRRISFIFQTFHLVARMTALRNVELPMIFAGVAPAERRRRATAALESVGLAARATHRPDQLSGGERQRVAIARAIVMEPDILLADEPTGNLDTASGGEIVALLKDLNGRGLSIVLVTHDPSVAAQARRILRMRDGRIVGDEALAGARA
ncbi:MAG TPA: ABC transporter ATP-binding protein [Candidatus Eisenbacteria bacterium]|nr:ABC transporter ATP-binding protein [Candidatus Eisenbacteria bacterium]